MCSHFVLMSGVHGSGFATMIQSERHNGMEAATLILLLTCIFLGLMNPTDLSLAVLNSSGALVLPHDTTITAGICVVCSLPPKMTEQRWLQGLVCL